jgi:hypothetical protein
MSRSIQTEGLEGLTQTTRGSLTIDELVCMSDATLKSMLPASETANLSMAGIRSRILMRQYDESELDEFRAQAKADRDAKIARSRQAATLRRQAAIDRMRDHTLTSSEVSLMPIADLRRAIGMQPMGIMSEEAVRSRALNIKFSREQLESIRSVAPPHA